MIKNFLSSLANAKLPNSIAKRDLDIVVAAGLLVLLSSFLLGIAVGVWKKMGRPIFYQQERVGRHGKLFKIIKFRTMVDKSEEQDDKKRITPYGERLRDRHWDELPQLVHVLFGQMSLVGPRPLPRVPEYTAPHGPDQEERESVRPGITGLDQINRQSGIEPTISKRIEWDLDYIRDQNLWNDVCILFRTLKIILKGGCDHVPARPSCPNIAENVAELPRRAFGD